MTSVRLAMRGTLAIGGFHRDSDSQGFVELKRDATDAGDVGGQARKLVEQTIGKPVVSSENYLALTQPKKQRTSKQRQPKRLPQPSQASLLMRREWRACKSSIQP